MCIIQQPLSTVRYLGEALSLDPIADPESPQPENQRTPDELAIFRRTYLSNLARSNLSITEQDQEEMRMRGLPPITEADLAVVREIPIRRPGQQPLHTPPMPMPLNGDPVTPHAPNQEQLPTQQPRHLLPLRLNSGPVTPQAPNPGPTWNPGTPAFDIPRLDEVPSLMFELRAVELANAYFAGATDEGAGRRDMSGLELHRWMRASEEQESLRRRRADNERGGEGGSGG